MAELTPEQIKRVEYLATDEWVVDTGADDDEARSLENFHAALRQMSSIELHHFACNFNWDCGTDELAAVIEHPECDAGTAMMIFWLGQPTYYYRRHRDGKLAEHEHSAFNFLRHIDTRLMSNDFANAAIACDPFDIMGQPMTRGTDREREVLDSHLFNKLDGEVVQPYMC
jgi:hypothetical protein